MANDVKQQVSPQPWRYYPNGSTPEVDGYIIKAADDTQVALVEKKEDAIAICAIANSHDMNAWLHSAL